MKPAPDTSWDDILARIDLAGCDDPEVLAAAERDLQECDDTAPGPMPTIPGPAVAAPSRPRWRRWQWLAAAVVLVGSMTFLSFDRIAMLWPKRNDIDTTLSYDVALAFMNRDWGSDESRNAAASKVSWDSARALMAFRKLFLGKDVPEALRRDCRDAAAALDQQFERGHGEIGSFDSCFPALVALVVNQGADLSERRAYLAKVFASMATGVAALQAMPRDGVLVNEIPGQLRMVRGQLHEVQKLVAPN